jgi:hypothetical protein
MKDTSFCKIGLTNYPDKKLKAMNEERNDPEDTFQFVFVCESSDMVELEYATRVQFKLYRPDTAEEFFFLTEGLFKMYTDYIKAHPLFEEVIFHRKELYYKPKDGPMY